MMHLASFHNTIKDDTFCLLDISNVCVCVCAYSEPQSQKETMQPLGSKQDIPNFISCVEVY